MLSKTIATFLLVTGLMQNSFFGTMPDRNINNELFFNNNLRKNFRILVKWVSNLLKIY